MCSIRYCHLIPPAVAGGIRLQTSPEPPALALLAPHDGSAQPARGLEGSRDLLLSIVHLDEERVRNAFKQWVQIN